MNQILYPDFSGELIDITYGTLFEPDSQEQIYPDSGTITVKDTNGDIIINAASVTINAVTGSIFYDYTTAESTTILNDSPNFDFRAEWSFINGASTYEFVTYFDALPWQIESQLSDQDIIDTLPILDDKKNKVAGKATGGTTTTVIDTHLNDPSSDYIGAELEIKTGANKGHTRQVITYNPSTTTFTVDKAFPYTVQSKDSYYIFKGFAPTRRLAFKQIIAKLKETFGGTSISELIDFSDVTIAHRYLSVGMLAQQRMTNSGDMFDAHSQKNFNSYAEEMNRVQIKFQQIGQDGEDNSDIIRQTPLLKWAR